MEMPLGTKRRAHSSCCLWQEVVLDGKLFGEVITSSLNLRAVGWYGISKTERTDMRTANWLGRIWTKLCGSNVIDGWGCFRSTWSVKRSEFTRRKSLSI